MQIIYNTAKPFDKLLKKQKPKAGATYRPMYYVVEQPVDEGVLLYHTMTKAFLLLTPEEAEIYKTHPADLQQLIDLWFLVPEDHDDRLLARQIRDVAKMIAKPVNAITHYTIMTTTDCNARCFYCYEKGRSRIPMNRHTALQTAKFIISHSKKMNVSIQWFGGEPLFNKFVITLICKLLTDAGIKYTSTMVSNGYLFTETNIKEAKDYWHLKEVQITLDGTEKIYNRSKAFIHKDKNPFRRVINNIHHLQDEGINVCIRFNIDVYNAEDLSELADELGREFSNSKRLSIYLHPLLETTNESQTMHDEQKRKFVFEKMNEIESKLYYYNLIRPNRLRNFVRTNNCMADSDDSIVIAPNGSIGKCEHFTDDHFIGHIESQICDKRMLDDFRKTHGEINACTTCFNYPNCIWLLLCQSKTNCYKEDCNHELIKLRRSILRTYQDYYNNEQKNEIQD